MVTFGLPVLLQEYISPVQKKPTGNAESVSHQVAFTSVPPEIAIANSQYLYSIGVRDSSGGEVVVSIKDKPSWLVWQQESNSLVGIVPKDIQSFTISIDATGSTVANQSFTVTVEQPQVKGITSTQQWEDPFHPPKFVITPSVEPTSLFVSPIVTAVLGESTVGDIPATPQERNMYLAMIAVLLFFAGIFASRLISLLFTKNKTYFEGVVVQRGRRT